MSIIGKIQSIFLDREKTQPIFPITKTKAVSDDTGRNLDVILDDKASKDFVTAEIAKAQLGGESGEIDLSGFATKEDISNHTNNKNNPHGVIPEQIGAHPNTWMPTIAEIGAAPAGYGYGGTPKTGAAVFSNLSEMGLGLTASCTTEAFVKALKGHSNVQFMHNKDNAIRLTDAPFDYGTVEFHKGANDNYIYGIGVDIKGNIYVYKYHPSQTDTNGWYYDNPPMTDGVEYRTTERYNGRVVYAKLVNMGKLTAGGITKVDVNLGSKIIRYAANNDWAGVPMDEETGYEIRVKKVCPTYIEMFSGASNTNATAHVLVWYFK